MELADIGQHGRYNTMFMIPFSVLGVKLRPTTALVSVLAPCWEGWAALNSPHELQRAERLKEVEGI